jgi:RNA polymerase sigma factor (sigma-70 family)
MPQAAEREEVNPFVENDHEDQQDRELVAQARAGSSPALEALCRRHQGFLYNLSVRMLYCPQDAEDATQEILIKLVTKLSTFEGRSRFRTWLYRIATNHLLNIKRGRMEPAAMSLADYGRALDETPELDLPDAKEIPVDVRLLVDEARIGCTMAMLLCFDREQRLVYILGEILGATSDLAAELLELTSAAFRQKLSRARTDLHSFMNEKCGLVNKANPCRCEKKTRGFMRAGYVDPNNLLFARERVRQVREVAARNSETIEGHADLCSEVYREHPFLDSSDLAARVRAVVTDPEFRAAFEV